MSLGAGLTAAGFVTAVLAAATLALTGCDATPPDPPAPWRASRPTAWLVGQRILSAAPEWGFDAEARPRVRVLALPGEAGRTFRLRWRAAWGPPVPVPAVASTQADGLLLSASALPGVALGPGHLELLDEADHLRARWPTRLRFAPSWPTPTPGDATAAQPQSGADPPAGEPAVWAAIAEARALQTAGRSAEAEVAWRSASAQAEALGWLNEAGRGLRAAAFVAERARRYASAEALLNTSARFADPALDPLGAARLAYARGLLAQQLGDLRGARAALAEAADTFAAFGETAAQATAAEALALLLSDLGAHAAARAQLDGPAAPDADAPADTRARHHHNRAWIALRGAAEGAWALDPGVIVQDLEAARTLARSVGEVEAEADARASLAWVALLRGEPEQAAAEVAAVRALDPAATANARRFVDLIEGEVWLARGAAARALTAFAALEAAARAEVGDRVADLAWRARFGQGRAQLALGDEATALTHFKSALSEVDVLARQTALHDDRGHLLAGRQALVEATVGLLLDRGAVSEAFAVADAARARVLSAFATRARLAALDPESRAQWQAAVAEVGATRETLALVKAEGHRVPLDEEAGWRRRRDTWAAEARRALEAAVARLDALAPPLPAGDLERARAALPRGGALVALAPTPEGYTAWVLRPDGPRADRVRIRAVPGQGDPWPALADLLHGVDALVVVPGGHPGVVPGLARPGLNGRAPWLLRAEVTVLPVVGLAQQPTQAPEGAPLVVDDARGDLPWARREGAAVAARFPGARRLSGSAARRGAVLDAMGNARLVHFAGHGVLRPEDPWSAHLVLAGSERIDLGDLLATPLDGAVVVLAGCDTGVDAVLGSTELVGLPEALVAAGARAVVATDRPLPDATGRLFAEAFYAAGGDQRPAAGVLAAARALHAAGDPDWAAFRVIGRN